MNYSTKISVLFMFIIISSQIIVGQNEVSEREVIALLELKAKTKGHLWINQWDETKPIATWHGVTIKDGKVVGLDLSNNNLKGRIPITIGNLRHLEILNLSDNHLKGRMPRLYRKFKNLKSIDLSNNAIVGTIPAAIYKLQNLEELNLSNNKIDGEIPQRIAELSKLKTLNLASNSLVGRVSLIRSMKNIKELNLTNNDFSNFDTKHEITIANITVK